MPSELVNVINYIAFSIQADCIKHWRNQSDTNFMFYDILFKMVTQIQQASL